MSQRQKVKRGVATKTDNQVSVAVEEAESYSPYPPPELVKAFEDIQSGMADRLMQIVEKEQAMSHEVARHHMFENNRINTANIENQTINSKLFSRGLICAFTLNICLMLLAGYAIYKNQPVVAGIAISTLSAILIILVLRKVPRPDQSKTGN